MVLMCFFLKFIINLLVVLLTVAFSTLLERKILGLVGLRMGPLKVSIFGILQPFSDALKLAGKQDNMLSNSFNFVFFSLGLSFLVSSLCLWLANLLYTSNFCIKMDLLIILLVLSFNTIFILLMGWVSSSKFSIIGCIRAATQAISYEPLIIIMFLFICLLNGSFSMNSNFNCFILIFMQPLCLMFWLVSILAEMGRTPYDFSEGESELVSGFNTEFGSKNFAFIFLSEYSNIVFISTLTVLIFFGFSLTLFIFFLFWFIWIRSVLPRSRFDFLMSLSWKFLIPFFTFYLVYFIIFSCI